MTSDELVTQLPVAIRILYNDKGKKPEQWDYTLVVETYWDWRDKEKWCWTAGYEHYESTLDDAEGVDMRGYGDTIQECLSNLLNIVNKMSLEYDDGELSITLVKLSKDDKGDVG